MTGENSERGLDSSRLNVWTLRGTTLSQDGYAGQSTRRSDVLAPRCPIRSVKTADPSTWFGTRWKFTDSASIRFGHVAIQYAKAMVLHVAAVDLGPEKMALARQLGAEIVIDAKTQDPPTEIQKQIGGAHGVLVTAVSNIAFKQAIGMLRRGGNCVLNGLPAGEFPVSIFDVVLNRYTIRGSIVGTRLDLAEALAFAAEGKVKATIETQPLASINDVFARLKTGKVNGRIVLGIGKEAPQDAFRKVSTAA